MILLRDAIEDPLARVRSRVPCDDGELVASGPAGQIGTPQRIPDRIAERLQREIACWVTGSVVDQLQTANIEPHNEQRALLASGQLYETDALADQAPSVQKSGERVGIRQFAYSSLRLLAVGRS